MDTIVVLKFGGSSVADNIKLNVVAKKIIDLKKEVKNIVVVVSAQGKMTDQLIKDAKELSAIPNERDKDMLISVGEQITASKLSILLNRMGYKSVSLSGWQVGIVTNNVHGNAKIEKIYTKRIEEEFKKDNIVIVTGFQGVNENNDITTLGRGGSDTTAVALQAALNADKCYIFSDVDGIYSSDPRDIKIAKKLSEISFKEMQEISDAGAKVLHNRCIQIGDEFGSNIEIASTFSNDRGTRLCKNIEVASVKGIVRNDKLITFELEKNEKMSKEEIYKFYNKLIKNNIMVEKFQNDDKKIKFRSDEEDEDKIQEILEESNSEYCIKKEKVEKLVIVGYGIIKDNKILSTIVNILEKNNIEIFDINLEQSKIEIMINKIDNNVIEELHKKLI